MISFPHCKINLGLKVLSKRADGYHNISSVFYPVPLFDMLEIVDSSTEMFDLKFSGLEIPGNSGDNLITKAYQLISKDFTIPPIKVMLHKNIPMGAGLGGGSADGAFMLRLMNQKFQLHISTEKLEGYAAQLGSDCPFFIEDKPKLISGRGEVMNEIDLNIDNGFIKIIHPGIHVSTAEAYAMLQPKAIDYPIEKIIKDKTCWKKELVNDFQTVMVKKYPLIQTLIEEMYEQGAYYAAMSGSGSSVFGFFEQKTNEKSQNNVPFQWFGKLGIKH